MNNPAIQNNKSIYKIMSEWNLIVAVCYQLKQLKKQPEKH